MDLKIVTGSIEPTQKAGQETKKFAAINAEVGA